MATQVVNNFIISTAIRIALRGGIYFCTRCLLLTRSVWHLADPRSVDCSLSVHPRGRWWRAVNFSSQLITHGTRFNFMSMDPTGFCSTLRPPSCGEGGGWQKTANKLTLKRFKAAFTDHLIIQRPEDYSLKQWYSTVFLFVYPHADRLCGLVVRVLGYRSSGPGSIPGTSKKK
jgi:hypothetical protein